MQTLQWEDAWERTVAPRDKQYMEDLFESFKNDGTNSTFIRQAHNHRGALLVTVLIHNRSNEALHIKETAISYTNACKETYISTFTLPLAIPANTSMPWTFIFENKDNVDDKPVLELACK